MVNLTKAHEELYRRSPDESFASLPELARHCQAQKERAADRWLPPYELVPSPVQGNGLALTLGDAGSFTMNDWSFTQLCQLSRISKDTVNRLSPDTAHRVFRETIPTGAKPLQIFTQDRLVRSVHGVSYTRLHNADILGMLSEFATDFQAPQQAVTGGTGLYAGEQDMFVFLIDPTGWAEIDGEAFAPGFFLWNSEVGKRSLGIETFWFQAVCQNHIVWDAVEVVDFSRKHTANVRDSLAEIRTIIEQLVRRRDERRDGFVNVIKKAMTESLGADAEEALKAITEHGIPKSLAKSALDLAKTQGRFTIFSIVDALTRLSSQSAFAGERTESDRQAARLLELAA